MLLILCSLHVTFVSYFPLHTHPHTHTHTHTPTHTLLSFNTHLSTSIAGRVVPLSGSANITADLIITGDVYVTGLVFQG